MLQISEQERNAMVEHLLLLPFPMKQIEPVVNMLRRLPKIEEKKVPEKKPLKSNK